MAGEVIQRPAHISCSCQLQRRREKMTMSESSHRERQSRRPSSITRFHKMMTMSITIAIICYMISLVAGHGYLKSPRSRNLVACKLLLSSLTISLQLQYTAHYSHLVSLSRYLLSSPINTQIKIRIGNRTYHKPAVPPQIHIPKIVHIV